MFDLHSKYCNFLMQHTKFQLHLALLTVLDVYNLNYQLIDIILKLIVTYDLF